MAEYPYLRSNKNLPQIFEKIRTAAKPPKFTIAFVKQLGFTSSNDAAYPSLLKKLGYLMEDGTPTAYYDDLRDSGTMGRSLASRIRELYSELFVINTKINEASEGDIKGAISRVTGKEAKDVTSIASTFRALCGLADFSEPTETVQEIAHNFEEKDGFESVDKLYQYLTKERIPFKLTLEGTNLISYKDSEEKTFQKTMADNGEGKLEMFFAEEDIEKMKKEQSKELVNYLKEKDQERKWIARREKILNSAYGLPLQQNSFNNSSLHKCCFRLFNGAYQPVCCFPAYLVSVLSDSGELRA